MIQSQSLLPGTQTGNIPLNLSQPDYQQYFVENLFELAIMQKQTSTRIIMDVLYNRINTNEIPTIVDVLQAKLPSVLYTTCYNDQNLPFDIEVQNTEIGHLFEHILLEYLCQLKLAKGAKQATFAGKTRWYLS